MHFDCKQFLQMAESLVMSEQPDQARLRTAAGRAYYAVYGLMRSGVEERGGGWPTESSKPHHTEIMAALAESHASNLKELYEYFKQLHVLRVHADYKYRDPISRRQVIANIEIGRKAAAIVIHLSKADFTRLRRSLFR